jgi:hypothetical protein
MKKLLGIVVLGLLLSVNGYAGNKFIVDCELKDGMFKSSFTNFDKKYNNIKIDGIIVINSVLNINKTF